MKAIILAAGIGSRLGNSNPKPLTKLNNGESILGRQVAYLSEYLGVTNIIAIVGYKKDLIMESFPNLLYVYNNFYDTTNTSKSLLAGLNKIENENVLWLNGDVVFEKELLPQIIKCSKSCMAVNTNSVGEEEIKYNIFDDGNIKEVSKTVSPALGEAVGINKLISSDLSLFKENLEKCDEQDYFEKALELSIQDGMKIMPVDINKYLCMEIDFEDDLEQINKQL
jgi:choline kinase